jgi:hypothetical protein
MKRESPPRSGLSFWLMVPPQWTEEELGLLPSLSEEADQELGIPGGKIELEDGFLDEGLNRPDGIFLQDAGNPFDGAAQVFSIR